MTCILDSLFFGCRMERQTMAKKKKMRLCASVQKTFEEGFQEFILDCKSRNLRQGTIIH